MADEDKKDKKEQPIIVKKIVKGGGHHGGAWKVAYADFVTAMMAFFLLMWLLNISTDEEKGFIANYFDPARTKVAESKSGAGGVLGGLSMSPQGAMTTELQKISSTEFQGTAVNNQSAQKSPEGEQVESNQRAANNTGAEEQSSGPSAKVETQIEQVEVKSAEEEIKEELAAEEIARMEEAKDKIEEMMEENPELSGLKENLIIDMTPEGLRIQIVDREGRSMFASGSANMFDLTQKLLVQVGQIIQELPNELSIRGHTDSVPYGPGASYTNWELSSDRANASRRVLRESGFPAERINNVVGKADTEHLVEDDPDNPRNRRISVILLKEALTDPNYAKKVEKMAEERRKQKEKAKPKAAPQAEPKAQPQQQQPQVRPPIGTFRRTPGAVEFP